MPLLWARHYGTKTAGLSKFSPNYAAANGHIGESVVSTKCINSIASILKGMLIAIRGLVTSV